MFDGGDAQSWTRKRHTSQIPFRKNLYATFDSLAQSLGDLFTDLSRLIMIIGPTPWLCVKVFWS